MSANLELRESLQTEMPKGYRVYKIKGVDQTIVARKGGPTAEQIKNKDSYKELRNNQKEFGIASILAKAVRDSLPDELKQISEKYTSGKLTAQFRNITRHDSGKTGTRSFALSQFGSDIEGFEFNSEAPFPQAFKSKFFVKEGSHRGHAILHFPAFTPVKVFDAPEGTTNFKINAHMVTLSDYYYDEEIGAYFPSNPDFQGKVGSFESQMLPLLKIPTQPITAQVSANNGKPVPAKTGIFLLLSVRFFHYENSRFTQLSKESSLQIMKVY